MNGSMFSTSDETELMLLRLAVTRQLRQRRRDAGRSKERGRLKEQQMDEEQVRGLTEIKTRLNDSLREVRRLGKGN